MRFGTFFSASLRGINLERISRFSWSDRSKLFLGVAGGMMAYNLATNKQLRPSHFLSSLLSLPVVHMAEDQKETIKPKKERLVLRMIKDAAKELGLNCETYSGDWIIVLEDPKTKETRFVWGYKFGLNSQVSGILCDDKAALSDILNRKKIPHIQHHVFLNPGMQGWAPEDGVFSAIMDQAKKYNFNVVIKPTDGTGGIDVFHCTSRREIEKAVIYLFNKNHTLVVSPYEKIQEEYRVIILDGEVRLFFKKDRPFVLGDGVSSLRDLLATHFVKTPKAIDGFLSARDNISKDFNLSRVPLQGESVPIIWKHNLGGGAEASVEIPVNDREPVIKMAQQAVKAVGVRFASADVIKVENEFKIMEINSGVMMENAPTFVKDGERIARTIYKDAIQKMFDTAPQPVHEETLSTSFRH